MTVVFSNPPVRFHALDQLGGRYSWVNMNNDEVTYLGLSFLGYPLKRFRCPFRFPLKPPKKEGTNSKRHKNANSRGKNGNKRKNKTSYLRTHPLPILTHPPIWVRMLMI